MEAPVLTVDPDESLTQTATALEDDVNAFLLTLPIGDVREIRRETVSVGKYGLHLLISITVIYIMH